MTKFVAQAESVRGRELTHRNGEFFRIVADQWIIVALIGHLEELGSAAVVDPLRKGVKEVLRSYELGHATSAEGALRDFGAALAAGDRAGAHFLASLPKESWGFPASPPDRVPSWIARSAFAIFRGDEQDSATFLDLLQGLVFDIPLARPVASRKPEFEATFGILDALVKKDGKAFDQQMTIRQTIRADGLRRRVGHAPLELVDLPGLGFCRIALDRGMSVQSRSVYLPVDLLHLPPPAAS